jgi:p-hydroxybenzoate 3-monooxygenase
VYAQHEVIKDLIQTRLEVEGDLRFAVEGVALHDIDSTRPSVTYRDASGTHTIDCELIAGCDGSQGTCKGHVPEHVLTTYERVYPFGWFGIMVEAPPSSDELIYASHERGFALVSTRSSTLQRMYFQCDPSDRVENWPDARIWQELRTLLATRDGWTPHEGPITQKVIVGMRSAVTEPMQYGRLYLAGDAAHIVPPTGAKGLNLAIADVRVLADAMIEFFTSGETESLARYSATALDRVWKATRFSWWMTSLMHRFPDKDAFQRRVQLAELAYVSESRVAAAALAENYVGLPFAPRSHALSMDHTPRNIEIA